VDRLNIFGGVEGAADKVAGHELKSLVQIMECHIPGLRHPLLCIIDYLGFRLIAMSTLPIKGRASLIFGSMDGGKTVETNPETVKITTALGKKLNLKEHGLRHQPESTRIFTPADLELHRGDDDHVYALDFSRLFPPTLAQDHLPGGVFYQLFRPEFVRKYKKPLCSDSWTSFMARSETAESINEIKEAQVELMRITDEFGASLEEERPQVDLLAASEKLINLMHMNGINCRYLGRIWLACCDVAPYWRVVVLLEMVVRRMKRILFKRLRKAVLSESSAGVSACIASALKFLNVVFGESEKSTEYWNTKLRTSVVDYFFNGEVDDCFSDSMLSWKAFVVNSEHGRVLMNDVRAQLLKLFCLKTGLKLGELTTEALKNNPKVIRVETPFDDADLEDLGVTVTYLPIASFSGAKLKRLTAMETSRRGKAYELNMQASKLYLQALRMNPADAQLLRNCAEVEAAIGNNVRADEFFRLAMKVNPSDEGTAFKYAIFFDNSLQLNKAEMWYLKALNCFKKPSHRIPVMLATYADFLLTERRNLTLAQDLYEIVLSKHPKHVQTAHNLAVLLFETNPSRTKQLFKIALDNAEDESRVAMISRSCASFYMALQEVSAGTRFYNKYKDLRHLVSDHPPSLYHATRSIFGPEMNEIREILGAANQFKVRHLFWDELDEEDSRTYRNTSLKSRLQRNVQRLFQRLQVPCSSEISYIRVGSEQTPSWEFDAMEDQFAWADQNSGQQAQIGIVLGYQDGNGFQCFEEELQGLIVGGDSSLREELQGWDSFFQVKGFRKTLLELENHKAMLNVRRRAYLRMWSTVSDSFEEKEEDDADYMPSGPILRRSAPVRSTPVHVLPNRFGK
jgi:tetratricopeptide (TPR) repeat protein